MFWSAPKKKKDEDKEKQIKELKQVFPSIRRPNKDDTLFEITFVVDNQYSSLRVFIPADFPHTRPVLQAVGPITHPWLDQFKQVNGSDKLMQWTRNSSLVEVVEESLSALLTGTNQGQNTAATSGSASTGYPPLPPTPPVATAVHTPAGQHHHLPAAIAQPRSSFTSDASPYPALAGHSLHSVQEPPYGAAQVQYATASPASATAYSPAAAYPSPAPTTTGSTVGGNSASGRAAPVTPAPATGLGGRSVSGGLPSLPSSFPELEQLTSIQLQRLLTDQVALEAHLAEVESIKQMHTVIAQMEQTNAENARKNLSMESELAAAAEEAEAQQSALKVLVHEYREKLDAAKKKCETPLDAVLKELRATRDELDSRSEDLGASLVEGKLELGNFLTEFLEQRSRYHELNAKLKIIGK